MASLKYTIQIFGALLIASSLHTTTAFVCPEHCKCSVVEQGELRQNHAKCSNLFGLMEIGKTSSIQSLDISSIEITKLTNQLDKLTNLTKLDLSRNRLSEVPKLNKRIKILNLSNNRITSGKLSKIPVYVQSLNLSNNDITYLPIEMKKLASLKSLELHGNPINCTCETLHVRNWLQENLVWTDNVVSCSSPQMFKGQPWLKVKQISICAEGQNQLDSVVSDDNIDLNDVMLGDEPFTDNDSDEDADYEEDIEKEFIIAKESNDDDLVSIPDGDGSGANIEPRTSELFEGSADASLAKLRNSDATSENPIHIEEDDDEGSGSGGGYLPPFKSKIRIFEDETATEQDTTTSTTTSEPEAVTENFIVPIVKVSDTESAKPTENSENDKLSTDDQSADPSDKTNTQESNSTYVLLAILGILLVVLIAFVIFKKQKSNSRNRRDKNDLEARPGTELADMDSKLLGKPKNGNAEIIPLMLNKSEKPEQKKSIYEEPLLKKLDEIDAEVPKVDPKPNENNNNNSNGPSEQNKENAVTPNEPAHPANPTILQNGHSPDDDEVFLPKRYSPVYSPITGRVKIKLTETPKPRTPMLVTRSRSNAGDIITTPVNNLRPPLPNNNDNNDNI